MDREKVIKEYEDFVNGYECFCTSDDYEYEMHKAVLALLKEQEDLGTELTNAVELIHKKNERIEKLLKEQEADMIALKNAYKELAEKGSVIVRCKDCKYHGNICPDYCVNLEQNTNDDFYCADGVNKDE